MSPQHDNLSSRAESTVTDLLQPSQQAKVTIVGEEWESSGHSADCNPLVSPPHRGPPSTASPLTPRTPCPFPQQPASPKSHPG